VQQGTKKRTAEEAFGTNIITKQGKIKQAGGVQQLTVNTCKQLRIREGSAQ
jgi:hypothetical protein